MGKLRVGGIFYPESPSKGYLVSEKIILFGFSVSEVLLLILILLMQYH